MKLAEALLTRGTLQSKLNELRIRLDNNAIVQEDEEPAESPKELLIQVADTLCQLEKLIGKINLTNASLVYEGKTMTEMLAKRDSLHQEISIYRAFLDSASMTGKRARGSEIKLVSTVSVAQLQKQIDEKAQKLRTLEMKIQELNWITDLQE